MEKSGSFSHLASPISQVICLLTENNFCCYLLKFCPCLKYLPKIRWHIFALSSVFSQTFRLMPAVWGVLSGDTIKEAGDQSFPMVGVGLLYRGKGANQVIDKDGNQTLQDMDSFDPLSFGLEHGLC